jgi:uncharacterized protein YdeI (YjbR/CyaY-like superfamily)
VAKHDQRWEIAYDPQHGAGVPSNLQAALDANPTVQAFLTNLSTDRFDFDQSWLGQPV